MTYKNDRLADQTPLTTTFVPGESPTAAKMQGMIQQADAAIAYLEDKIGDLSGEEGIFNTWVATLARNIGDFSKINPAILPNFEQEDYEQNLIAGALEHELDILPVGELNDLLEATLDSCVVISQWKETVSQLEIPGDWTIEFSSLEDGQLKRGRKLVTHSPAEGGSIIFKNVTTGRGSSVQKSSENTIPNLAQAEDGGPFIELELVDSLTKTYQVTLPVRTKMYDKFGEIIDFTASNIKSEVGLNSQYELPQFFFGLDGLGLENDDEEAFPLPIPLNLIKLYDWDTKKVIEGILYLEASTSSITKKYQFTMQMEPDIILNVASGKYIIVVAGNSITNQLKGLVETVYGNTGVGSDMARLISHKNLMNLRTGSTNISDRSQYYGPSNINNNDHSMYFHRNGYTALDVGAGGNVIRGDVIIGNTATGTDDSIHENFNLDEDSYALRFGNVADGAVIKYAKEKAYTLDHEYGGLALEINDSGLWIEGATSDLNPSRKNIFLEGDIRTSGNIILGKLSTDIVSFQGKVYVNDELTMVPRSTVGITGEAGKTVYSSVENALVVHNGSQWSSPWNYAGYKTTIGDGITSFGKYNGTNYAVFSSAIAEVTANGGTIKVLPGTYNISINKISVPANVTIEGSGSKTIISGTGIAVELVGANASIINLTIQDAATGILVSGDNGIIDTSFAFCTKAIDVAVTAVNLKVLQNTKYTSCATTLAYSGATPIATSQTATKSAINYSYGSIVNDWNAKQAILEEYIPGIGSASIAFDDALDGAIGHGAFVITGNGSIVSKKMLPVNPNVGLGANINMRRVGANGVTSIGIICYDKDYGNLGTRYFLLDSIALGSATIEQSFYKEMMTGVNIVGMFFPQGTRYAQPIITVSSNSSGIEFDSFEVSNLIYARDITPYQNSKHVGEIMTFAGETVPDQFMACDGSAISRATYTELFEAIGVTHGVGNGITTFNLPDYRGRFLRGANGAGTLDPDDLFRTAMNTGGNTGNAVGSIQDDAFQGHWHNIGGGFSNTDGANPPSNTIQATVGGTNTNATASLISKQNVREPITDGVNDTPKTSSETRPKNAYVNYLIRYTVHTPSVFI
jgi:microcystin-dependent protein